MKPEKQKRLEQYVNYVNEEQILGEDVKLHYFANEEELVNALRRGEIPGVTWTEECEAKWQMEKRLENEISLNYEDYDDPWGAQL